MNINLHIDRLVIDDIGFDPRRLDDLKIAVQSELKRQLQSHGIGPGIQSLDGKRPVDGGQIAGSKSLQPKNFGQQIGKAIYRGINQ